MLRPKRTIVPLPRRRLSEPLAQSVAAEQPADVPSGATAAEAAAREAATMRPGEPMPASDIPAAPAAAAHEEPTLFQDLNPSAPTAAQGADDDLPPPAYDPAAAPLSAPAAEQQRPAPGTPTPEALARLRAAVAKDPDSQLRAPRMHTGEATSAGAAAAAGGNSRFGINSLINRMTGHGGEQQQQPQPRAQAQGGPQLMQDDGLEADGDLDRIEIPAFLRPSGQLIPTNSLLDRPRAG